MGRIADIYTHDLGKVYLSITATGVGVSAVLAVAIKFTAEFAPEYTQALSRQTVTVY